MCERKWDKKVRREKRLWCEIYYLSTSHCSTTEGQTVLTPQYVQFTQIINSNFLLKLCRKWTRSVLALQHPVFCNSLNGTKSEVLIQKYINVNMLKYCNLNKPIFLQFLVHGIVSVRGRKFLEENISSPWGECSKAVWITVTLHHISQVSDVYHSSLLTP